MDFSSINWLAVVACVVVSMISGTIWYNPKTLFPIWWAVVGAGKSQPGMENMGMTWGLTMLSSFVQAVAMAFMVNFMGSTTAGSGALTGLMLWFGFIAPTYLVNKLLLMVAEKDRALHLLQMKHEFVMRLSDCQDIPSVSKELIRSTSCRVASFTLASVGGSPGVIPQTLNTLFANED